MSDARPHPAAAVLAFVARVVSGASVRFLGGEPGEGQRIYFANHSSHLDAIVLWASLPPRIRPRVRPVAARDYWESGAVRRYLANRAFRAYLVERSGGPGDDRDRQERALQGMIDALGTRDSLILFPEGTRGSTNEPADFRSGLYHLARAPRRRSRARVHGEPEPDPSEGRAAPRSVRVAGDVRPADARPGR